MAELTLSLSGVERRYPHNGVVIRRSAPDPQDEVGSIVRREMLRFAVPAVAGVVVLALASLALSVLLAEQESKKDARQNAEWLARTVVAPHLTLGLAKGDESAIVALDDSFDKSVDGSLVVDARIWDGRGTVIYADDPRLIGEQFGTPPATDQNAVPLDPARSENRYLEGGESYLQVALPVTGADGHSYAFQMVQRQDPVQDNARQIWWTFVPILLGALVLVGVLLLLLALRMAKRLSSSLRGRQDLLQHAVAASELERRRIASDLHDGTVQQLAGVGYALSGLARRSARRGEPDVSRDLEHAAGQVQGSVRDLRSLLVDIYPPNIEHAGLHAALADAASALGPDVVVDLDIDEPADLDANLRTVIYRVAREAMTNSAKHARATHVQVVVAEQEGATTLLVTDDGRGFDPTEVPDGHLGLRILGDLAESVGGSLAVESAPGAGTRVRFTAGGPR